MPAFFCILILILCAQARVVEATSFDGWVRQSLYVPMEDGTRLALDYYRPTKAGHLHTVPLPVVWRFTPYGRHKLDQEGRLPGPGVLPAHGSGLNGPKAVRHLLENGYIVAVADWRGYGASFGVSETWLGRQQASDAREITDWLAAQEWSTDRVGMMGLSALASVQYLAATNASPHLKALFPAMGQFDHYDTFYLNGIFRPDLPTGWDSVIRPPLDFHQLEPTPGGVAPVDEDRDRRLLLAASAEHRANRSLLEQVAALQFRDSADAESDRKWHLENSIWPKLAEISRSGVAIYHWTGWFDAYGKAQLLTFANLDNPQKIHIGPYFHADRFGLDLFSEALRWFDYWLKGVDNGVMSTPRVRYFVTGETQDSGWRSADHWPPEGTQKIRFYLSAGRSGTVNSVNDGNLVATLPIEEGTDSYTVDPDLSLGGYVDRNNGVFRKQCWDKTDVADSCYRDSGYPDLAQRYDSGALTYTSAPLPHDLVMVGHPLVSLRVRASNSDADLFVVLEEVEADNRSHLLSDNALRLSHRAVNKPVFDTLGLPWLSNYERDASPLPPEGGTIYLDLKPVANKFDKGNRIRLTIAGADAAMESSVQPGQTLHLIRDPESPAWLEIPVLEAGREPQ